MPRNIRDGKDQGSQTVNKQRAETQDDQVRSGIGLNKAVQSNIVNDEKSPLFKLDMF